MNELFEQFLKEYELDYSLKDIFIESEKYDETCKWKFVFIAIYDLIYDDSNLLSKNKKIIINDMLNKIKIFDNNDEYLKIMKDRIDTIPNFAVAKHHKPYSLHNNICKYEYSLEYKQKIIEEKKTSEQIKKQKENEIIEKKNQIKREFIGKIIDDYIKEGHAFKLFDKLFTYFFDEQTKNEIYDRYLRCEINKNGDRNTNPSYVFFFLSCKFDDKTLRIYIQTNYKKHINILDTESTNQIANLISNYPYKIMDDKIISTVVCDKLNNYICKYIKNALYVKFSKLDEIYISESDIVFSNYPGYDCEVDKENKLNLIKNMYCPNEHDYCDDENNVLFKKYLKWLDHLNDYVKVKIQKQYEKYDNYLIKKYDEFKIIEESYNYLNYNQFTYCNDYYDVNTLVKKLNEKFTSIVFSYEKVTKLSWPRDTSEGFIFPSMKDHMIIYWHKSIFKSLKK